MLPRTCPARLLRVVTLVVVERSEHQTLTTYTAVTTRKLFSHNTASVWQKSAYGLQAYGLYGWLND